MGDARWKKPSFEEHQLAMMLKPLLKLFTHHAPNMEAEEAYNERLAETPPFCSVCSYFKTDGPPQTAAEDGTVEERPDSSEPIVLEDSFQLKSEGKIKKRGRAKSSGAKSSSPLLTCAECYVCIHASKS